MQHESQLAEGLRASASVAPPGRFAWLPVGLFGSVMGLIGMSVAWKIAHEHFGCWIEVSWAFEALAVLAFALMSLGYACKLATAPQAVGAEFRHPIGSNLFATFLISVVLLPGFIVPLSLSVARGVWLLGAASTTLFAWFIIDRWIRFPQQVVSATPAWLVPVVGLLNVPLAMPALGLAALRDVMVPYLAIGLFFTVPLFTLVFYRLLFEPPLVEELQPSLLILVAPFAVGTSTYIVTSGKVDAFAEALFTMTLFMLAVLIGRVLHLGVCCPFRTSWWSVSFPLAATAIAGMRMARGLQAAATDVLAIALLGLASAIVAFLLVQTAWRLARGEFGKPTGL